MISPYPITDRCSQHAYLLKVTASTVPSDVLSFVLGRSSWLFSSMLILNGTLEKKVLPELLAALKIMVGVVRWGDRRRNSGTFPNLESLDDVPAAEGAVDRCPGVQRQRSEEEAEVVEPDILGRAALAVRVHLLVAPLLRGEGLDVVVRVGEAAGAEEEDLASEDRRRHPVLEADLHVDVGRVQPGHEAVDPVVLRLGAVEEQLHRSHAGARAGWGGANRWFGFLVHSCWIKYILL
jgi:hypothetical protein